MSEDYECFANAAGVCDRCGASIGHVRGHFYSDCIEELKRLVDNAPQAGTLAAPTYDVEDLTDGKPCPFGVTRTLNGVTGPLLRAASTRRARFASRQEALSSIVCQRRADLAAATRLGLKLTVKP